MSAAAIALSIAFAGADGSRTSAQVAAVQSPCDIQTTERVVAVGDVHGAYDRFAGILRAAALVDARDRWIGGRAILIQTGDVLDRGPHSRRVLDLLRRLEREAGRAGGAVHALVGNHEFMRLLGDWRDVSAGEFRAFQDADSSDLRERIFEQQSAAQARRAQLEGRVYDAGAYRRLFMREIGLGFVEMRLAFDKNGEYGQWLRTKNAAVKVNGVLFLHGGVSEMVAADGCEGINATIRREMASLPVPPEQIGALVGVSETGPLWYRGLATEPESTFAPTLARILERLPARAIVVGHTMTGNRVFTRFGGRVVLLDTGMLNGEFFPAGVASALELHGGTVTAVYANRRETIAAPALDTPNPAPRTSPPQ